MSETTAPAPDAPDAEKSLDDPVIVSDAGVVTRRTTWVKIKDGIVEKIAHTYNALRHPFEGMDDAYIGQNDGSRMTVPMKGDAVIPGIAGMVAPGMLVDTKGNFTPTEGRTERLHPSEPAYLAGPQPQVVDGSMARSDPDDVLKASQDRTEAHEKKQEELKERLESDEAHDPKEAVVLNTERNPRSAEDVKAEEKPEEKTEEKPTTGFAAVDAKAS